MPMLESGNILQAWAYNRPCNACRIAASKKSAAGAGLAAVVAQMGHSYIQITATTYAHVTPGAHSRAAESMPPLDLVQDGAEKQKRLGFYT